MVVNSLESLGTPAYLYRISKKRAKLETLKAELVRCRLKLKQAEAEVERLNVIKNETPIDCDKVCVAYKYRVDENERLQTEVALLRKVEEVGEIMWGDAICHRCNARECRGCAAHDFKQALSDYATWKETNGG